MARACAPGPGERLAAYWRAAAITLVPGEPFSKVGPPCRRCFSRIATPLPQAGLRRSWLRPRPADSVPSGARPYQAHVVAQPAPAPFDWVQGFAPALSGSRKDAWRALGQQWGLAVEGGDPCSGDPTTAGLFHPTGLGAAPQLLNDPPCRPCSDKDGKTSPTACVVACRPNKPRCIGEQPTPLWLSFHACGEATSARCGKPEGYKSKLTDGQSTRPGGRLGWPNSWP